MCGARRTGPRMGGPPALAQVLAGVAIDTWGWSIFQVDGLAALLTVGGLIAWAIYFSLSRKHVAIAYKTDDVSAPVPAAAATRV